MICTCLNCKNDFEVKYASTQRKFCSKNCAMLYRWEHTKRNVREYECKSCGKKFVVPCSDHRIKEGLEIKYCSSKCAGIATRKGAFKKCPVCGKEFYTTRNQFCSQECARKYRHDNYVHKTYCENGYLVEYENGYNKKGNRKQHRKIMEEYIGRPLRKDEIVHHVNGKKDDNRIENLQIMSKGEHSSFHRLQEKKEGKHLFGGYHNN